MKKYAVVWCSQTPGDDTLRGRMLDAFRDQTERWDILHPMDEDFHARARGYDGYVISGSERSVVDDGGTPFVKSVLALIRVLYRRASAPVLGICFGAQAIAVALGGRVGRNPGGGFRLGVETLKWTDGVEVGSWSRPAEDAVVVESHGECVHELPARSLVLASSPTVANEIFLVDGRFLGVQGHPEVDNQALQDCFVPLHRPRFNLQQWLAITRESGQPLRSEAVIALGRRLLTDGMLTTSPSVLAKPRQEMT